MAICAALPALSITSPIRTRSPVTLTLPRSTGLAMSRFCATHGVPQASMAVATSMVRISMMIASPEQVRSGLQHLVGCGDHLGVHLVGALRRDQVGDFRHHLD